MRLDAGLIQTLCCVVGTALLYAYNVQGEVGQGAVPVAVNMVQEAVGEMTEAAQEIVEVVVLQEKEVSIPAKTESPEIVEEVPMELLQEMPSPMPVEEESGEYVDFAIADVNDYVNVRRGPDTEQEIVGKIYSGAVAQIVGNAGAEDDWFQIISGNVEGYIKGEYFMHGQEAAEVMDSYVVKYAEVQVEKLNVRAEASTGSGKVGYLEYGESVKVLEDCGEWLEIQYTAESVGYISAEYVAVSESYSYAVSPEEEKEYRRIDGIREGRKPVEQKEAEGTSEEVIPVVIPAVTYTSNEELRKAIIDYALQFVGNKYINGGSSLTKGTDCSGFTCFIYKEFGYSISRTPAGQYSGAGRSIDLSEVQPGDIICYSSNGGKSCTHVAFYVGDGKIVHSANSRKGVITSDIDFEPIIGVRNVID